MLGENLKNSRLKSGLTQEQAAEKLYVVRQTISKWEKGLSAPDANQLISISTLYSVSVVELLDLNVEEKPDNSELCGKLEEIKEQIRIKNQRKRNFWRAVFIFGIILFLWGAGTMGINIFNYNSALKQQNYAKETLQLVLSSSVRGFQKGCVRLLAGGLFAVFAGIILRKKDKE